MAEVLDATGPNRRALAAAEEAVRRGQLVVLPTDTVYGVAARPDRPDATARIFDAKRRPRGLTLPVLVATVRDAEGVAALDARARAAAERLWPGGVTLVLRRTEGAADWDLGEERDTVGVRVPDHPVAVELLRRTGPLATTSANRSGEPTPSRCEDVVEALGDAVSVYLCAGVATSTAPSTVVDLTGSEPRVLREGAVPAAEVLEATRG